MLRRIRGYVPYLDVGTEVGYLKTIAGTFFGTFTYNRSYMRFVYPYQNSDWIQTASVNFYSNSTIDIDPSYATNLSQVSAYVNSDFTIDDWTGAGSTDATYIYNNWGLGTSLNNSKTVTASDTTRRLFTWNVSGQYTDSTNYSGIIGYFVKYKSTIDASNWDDSARAYIALDQPLSPMTITSYYDNVIKLGSSIVNTLKVFEYLDTTYGPFLEIWVEPPDIDVEDTSYYIDCTSTTILNWSNINKSVRTYRASDNKTKHYWIDFDLPKINGKVKSAYLKYYLPKNQDDYKYSTLHSLKTFGTWDEEDPYSLLNRFLDTTSTTDEGNTSANHLQTFFSIIPDSTIIDGSDIGYTWYNVTGDQIQRNSGIEYAYATDKSNITFILSDNRQYTDSTCDSVQDLSSVSTIDQYDFDASSYKTFYTSSSDYPPELEIGYEKSSFRFDVLSEADVEWVTDGTDVYFEYSSLGYIVRDLTNYVKVRNMKGDWDIGGKVNFSITNLSSPTWLTLKDRETGTDLSSTYFIDESSTERQIQFIINPGNIINSGLNEALLKFSPIDDTSPGDQYFSIKVYSADVYPWVVDKYNKNINIKGISQFRPFDENSYANLVLLDTTIRLDVESYTTDTLTTIINFDDFTSMASSENVNFISYKNASNKKHEEYLSFESYDELYPYSCSFSDSTVSVEYATHCVSFYDVANRPLASFFRMPLPEVNKHRRIISSYLYTTLSDFSGVEIPSLYVRDYTGYWDSTMINLNTTLIEYSNNSTLISTDVSIIDETIIRWTILSNELNKIYSSKDNHELTFMIKYPGITISVPSSGNTCENTITITDTAGNMIDCYTRNYYSSGSRPIFKVRYENNFSSPGNMM